MLRFSPSKTAEFSEIRGLIGLSVVQLVWSNGDGVIEKLGLILVVYSYG